MPKSKNSKVTEVVQDYKNFVVDPVEVIFGKLVVIHNSKLTIKYGDHYGLVGKNGVGKTSLLDAIAYRKIAVPKELDMIYVKQEEVSLDKTVLEILLSSNEKLYQMNIRYEELTDIIAGDSEITDELLEEHATLEKEIGHDYSKSKAYAQKILFGLGFSNESVNNNASSLSGGWRMRISLAKALFMSPTLLILDEPTNHLDLHANIWLTEYLKNYPKTVIVVSHDRYFIDEVCNVIIHIENCKLNYYRCNYDQFQKQLKQDREKALKDWNAYEKKLIAMRKSNKSKTEVDEFIKKSAISKPDKEYMVNIKFLEPTLVKNNFITLENVGFAYPDNKPILHDINLVIDAKSRFALVGKNGLGKSTLLKLIVGELVPNFGEIIRSSVLKIGYYNQHFEESMPYDMNGVEYLMSLNKDIDFTLAHKYLSMFGLESIQHKVKIGSLSGGQKARVKFASFGVMRPHILVLDEPSNHLDIVAIESLIHALNNYDGAIMLVTHNFNIITQLNCELLVMQNKGIHKYPYDYDQYIEQVHRESE